jgi:hypothetical protein
MLFGETVAVWCENRTEHTDTLWAVRTSQETRYVSALYCENHTENTDTIFGQTAKLSDSEQL